MLSLVIPREDETPCITIQLADETFIRRRYLDINQEQYIQKRYNCDLWINIWANTNKQRNSLIEQVQQRILEAEANHYTTCKHYQKMNNHCSILDDECEALNKDTGRTNKNQCPNLKNYISFFKTNHIVKNTFKINSITDLDEIDISEPVLRTIFRLNMDYYKYYTIGGRVFDKIKINEDIRMTNNNKTEKTSKKDEPVITGEKLTLVKAVALHEEQEFVIIGALSKAGLLKQYNYEKLVYGKEDITPSITMTELDKIIKNFKG